MPWMVQWVGGGEESGPFATEVEALRHGCGDGRPFRLVDLGPDAGLVHLMLEPSLSGDAWKQVAQFIGLGCDRFWMHWWFRPPNDTRSIWEQLAHPAGSPPAEPLPPREALQLGLLASSIESVEPSWICPNGAAATGALTPTVLGLLLERELPWWDLHLVGQGRIRFISTDGGSEHFAWLSEAEMAELVAGGIERGVFRRLVQEE